ncbi:MAG: sigma-54-dependent Fis family transcriptional regulator [Nitrospinae bacterium]|nr:sigma-54-dependent Fis family transcriptional regulator [Nitrospinota bacterium]
MKAENILIIEDEALQRETLAEALRGECSQVRTAATAEDGLAHVAGERVDVVITDFKLPDHDGLHVLQEVKRINPEIAVIVITAYGSIDRAVSVMKAGAFDYLTKPVNIEELVMVLERACAHQALVSENARLRRDLGEKFSMDGVIARSRSMEEALNLAGRVAPSDASVLLQGESGTGKEVLARVVHAASRRKDGPFVAFNAAALPPTLVESELFGHEKGAFTGADYRKEGKFELAHKGTLLLDEVTEMSLPLQAKLLRVLQEHEIDKVGGRESIPVDVRVIATSNRDIKKRIRENLFREDLYYRLNVIPLKISPLRERKEDIPLLAEHFLQKHRRENNKPVMSIDESTVSLLKKYNWPGNIRELANIMERAAILCTEDTLLPAHLFFEDDAEMDGDGSSKPLSNFRGTIHQMEKELILQTLEEQNGNKTRAAESLGISIRTLRNKLTEYQSSG